MCREVLPRTVGGRRSGVRRQLSLLLLFSLCLRPPHALAEQWPHESLTRGPPEPPQPPGRRLPPAPALVARPSPGGGPLGRLQFRLQHFVPYLQKDGSGRHEVLYRSADRQSSAEQARKQRESDRRRHRGRQLDATYFNVSLGGGFLGAPGAYYINVTLGSANQSFHVQVDTGSDLFWVPCDCVHCETHTKYLPLSRPFQPARSSTALLEDCGGATCQQLAQAAPQTYGCAPQFPALGNQSDPYCEYDYTYADQSSTFGNIIADVLQLATPGGGLISPQILFGCGENQQGNLGDGTFGLDGLMGLGRGALSVVSQLAQAGVIQDQFALCLEGTGAGGHLVLGAPAALPPGAQQVAVLGGDQSTFYYVGLANISVGGSALPLQPGAFDLDPAAAPPAGGVLLDSGTTYTLLTSAAYVAFLSQVDALTSLASTTVYGFEAFHCYTVPAGTSNAALAAEFPPAALEFGGGVTWPLPAYNYMFPVSKFQACFGAMRSEGPQTIIGESWLRNTFLLFDRDNDVIQFAPFNCTTLQPLNIGAAAEWPAGAPQSSELSTPVSGLAYSPPPPPTTKQGLRRWELRGLAPLATAVALCCLLLLLPQAQ